MSQSPIETGGGGEQFEQQVAAFTLGLLLVRATPPILTDTSLVEVHFQSAHLGWCTDDILLVGKRSDGLHRKLGLQVKRQFTVSANNDECRKTIYGMWNDFQAKERFDTSADKLAIVTLHATTTLLHDFNSLLLCARASINVEDFEHRISLDGFLSQKARQQYDAIKRILTEKVDPLPENEAIWQFLRVINILSLDFNPSTAQAKASIVSLLSFTLLNGDGSNSAAHDSWAKLLECAGEGRPTARSYKYDDLPETLQKQHSTVTDGDRYVLSVLMDHGLTVEGAIRRSIGDSYSLNRSGQLQSLASLLAKNQVVIVSGIAGSGKSALVCNHLDLLRNTYPILSFQAVEFAVPSMDQTLANAQAKINTRRLIDMLAGHDTKIFFIDGVERLLEHSVRDAFSHLMELANNNPSVKVILTVRDYSLETVRHAFIPRGMKPGLFHVPTLSDNEIDYVGSEVPELSRPLGDSQLRRLLRTPYLMDLASRLEWNKIPFPDSFLAFRKTIWKYVVRVEDFSPRGLPARREQVFLDIAWCRARVLRSFVRPSVVDEEALSALRQDSLVLASGDSPSLYAVAHDVLEDWSVIQKINESFAESEESLSKLSSAIGGYPALRRGFRLWLAEQFEIQPNHSPTWLLQAMEREDLPSYFRDDCIVAVLVSNSAAGFLRECREQIANGDIELLERIVHMLRTAFRVPPDWLNIPGLQSQLLVPKGTGWAQTLRLILSLIDKLLPHHAPLVLGFIEDWSDQISWANRHPEGTEEAGTILGKLLSEVDEYNQRDARKRILKVVVKVPSAVPQFAEYIERAKTSDFTDQIANDLLELVLTKPEGSFVCKDFPDEVASLITARIVLADTDQHPEEVQARDVIDEFEYAFGVNELPVGSYFPPSALQGPFGALLRYHPQKAVPFFISLINHAADWYAKKQKLGHILEPAMQVSMKIKNIGNVEQWANSRFYCLYRGNQVGPDSIVSVLMALESWLLALGQEEVPTLDEWLLYILRNSNNVMATGVVASVCTAYPGKANQTSLTLLASKTIVQLDRQRLASEIGAASQALFGLNPSYGLFEQERVKSNELPHRREDLEALALRMQLTEYRGDVWAIIDDHRNEVAQHSHEDTREWRLALHRMDIRGFKPQKNHRIQDSATPEDMGNEVMLGPGELESDVRDMVDQASQSHSNADRYIGLQNLARKTWEGNSSVRGDDWKTSLLAEAQAIESELGEPEEFYRNGPGIAAAVCIRDHLNELDELDFKWCTQRIEFEIRRTSHATDGYERSGRIVRSDRVCASVVPLLITTDRRVGGLDPNELLNVALTHPIEEVCDFVFDGLGRFIGDEHKTLAIQCATAALFRSRLASEHREKTRRKRLIRFHSRGDPHKLIVSTVLNAIKNARLDRAQELESLDFDNPLASSAIRANLAVLGQHPNWDESREFYSWIAQCLFGARCSNELQQLHRRRNHELETVSIRSLARFVLQLPCTQTLQTCMPLVDAAVKRQRETEWFVSDLIASANGNTHDSFWYLWQSVADKIVDSNWAGTLGDEESYDLGLLNTIFLRHYWKEDVKHWHRLDGHAHRLDELACNLPAMVPVLHAYTHFLYTIGRQSLPNSFKTVGHVLMKGNTPSLASHSGIAFNLESILRPYVYSHPHRLKSDSLLREAVLAILDALVEGGSASAYQMRDDFVTPSSKG